MEGLILSVGDRAVYKGKTYMVSKELSPGTCRGCDIRGMPGLPCHKSSDGYNELLNTLGYCSGVERSLDIIIPGVIFVEQKVLHINFMEE